MIWTSILIGLFVWILWRYISSLQDEGDLIHIPGPNINIWWDLVKPNKPDQQHTHKNVSTLALKYGPVFKIPQFGGSMIFVSGFDAIYKVLVTFGKEFGGRDNPYRVKAVYKGTGIVHSEKPDIVWKTLRMTVQRHLKQFGEGMSRLEDVIVRVSDDSMFTQFSKKINKPFDPKEVIFETALRTVIFLICGDLCEEDFTKIINLMKRYLDLIRQCHPVVVPIPFRFLDAHSWLRFLGIGPTKIIKEANEVKNEIWDLFDETQKKYPDEDSILKVFREHQESGGGPEKCLLNEDDLKSTCVLVLTAGIITTTDTFHALMNIFAHHENVQDKILAEAMNATGENFQVGLNHRSQMPYTRATLFEALRYTSVVALGVGRTSCKNMKLNDFVIPKGTRMSVNLWHLHHDPDFWGDPENFRPERFLDENGDVIPADHPNRKNLMPFGAGARVCVAESLAMSRLFLWISSLICKFELVPAPGNLKSSAKAEDLIFHGLICAKPYEIILKERKK